MIKVKKSLGQNFLIDKNILEKITNTTIIKNKTILEIGPGTGNLTSYILKKNPKKLFVVEKDNKLAKDLVRIFKLLSDETRLRILYSLSQAEELHVRALCELLQLSQPAVSHHLGMLRNAGIVDPRRDGKHNYYRILPGNFEQLLMLVFD